jgi:hypothetical protein
MKIALVNCVILPEADPDEAPLLDALRAAGHHARTLAWDDPGADPAGFDACVLRATWNYHRHLGAFRDWLTRAAASTCLINPLETVLWNLHKAYLRDLESRRIPTVPTAWADRGRAVDLAAVCDRHAWTKVVVKPSVSAGSRDTRVFDLASDGVEAAQAFLDASTAREDTMIQRYMPGVERGGELSIICLGGEVSHAVEKGPRFAGQPEAVRPRPNLTDAQRRFAHAVLDACPVPTPYARVDVMLSDAADDREIMLSELELIEPSLFFRHGPGSADRFVRVIEREAASRGGAST